MASLIQTRIRVPLCCPCGRTFTSRLPSRSPKACRCPQCKRFDALPQDPRHDSLVQLSQPAHYWACRSR